MDTQTFASRLSTLSPSRRDGLTAIFRKAQERVLPAAPTGWLNPEDSIGRYIGRAKWDHIWEAIGPARDAFNKVAPRIKEYLESAVEPISSRVTWTMYMIGRSGSLASPSIIFCCEVLQHRRQVRDTIKESGILSRYPGIKTGHLARPPDFDRMVPLGAEEKSLYRRGDLIALTSQARSACGSQLFINAGESDSVPLEVVPTIGGVIRLGSNYYYTTAAHALAPPPDPGAADGALPAGNGYDSDGDALSLDGDEVMYNVSTPDTSADGPSGGQSLGRAGDPSEDNRYMRDHIMQQWSLKRTQGPEEPSSTLQLGHSGDLSPNPIGWPFMSSTEGQKQEAGLDYALMELSASRNHIVENVIEFGTNDGSTVKVHSVARSEVLQNVDVIAVTPRGVARGLISGTPVYSSVPGERPYHRMLKVSLEGPLGRGDCGTWVVDATNGDLFGHIVLGSPGGGTALLTPFSDIFDDILSRVGKIPTFPTALDDEQSSTSAAISTSPVSQDEPLSRIIRNTISMMSERQDSTSPQDDTTEKRMDVSPLQIGIQPEEPDDLLKGKGKHEGPIMEPLSEVERGVEEHNVYKRDNATLPITSPDGEHQAMAQQPESTTSDWVGDPSKEFGRLMGQKRLKSSRRHGRALKAFGAAAQANPSALRASRTEESPKALAQSSQPPSYMPLHIKSSQPPTSPRYHRFRDVLFALCNVPMQWENPDVLDLALKEIDLKSIYSDAEEEHERFISLARSKGIDTEPEWGHQDCVVRALSRYFTRSFFTRVGNPLCEACGSKLPTIPRGNSLPTPRERAGKAEALELYQCSEKDCQAYTRFPRYWDVMTLLGTRRGRAGESGNCFGMICRALGSRVRWVWNAEDNIWTEVYSEHQKRWVHVDASAASWDNPLLYTETMGHKLSYCIAFSSDGATDVTRRYVRASEHALPRARCSEPELLRIIHDIKRMRRIDMSSEDLVRLTREDIEEAQVLESFASPPDAAGTAGHWQPEDVKLTKRKSGMLTPRTSVSAPLISEQEVPY